MMNEAARAGVVFKVQSGTGPIVGGFPWNTFTTTVQGVVHAVLLGTAHSYMGGLAFDVNGRLLVVLSGAVDHYAPGGIPMNAIDEVIYAGVTAFHNQGVAMAVADTVATS